MPVPEHASAPKEREIGAQCFTNASCEHTYVSACRSRQLLSFVSNRGGGELGLDWWKDGHGMKKQHTFDDFVSCAQYLVQMNITSPSKLAIQVHFITVLI